MRGVIVAAGEGKRMRPITYWRPKPLVPVADVPLIVHIIRGFVGAGVREIAIVIGHLGDKMKEALGDGSQWGASLSYAVQDEPKGTADAVLRARELLGDEPFMLSWGDILVPPGHYRRVAEAFGGAAAGGEAGGKPHGERAAGQRAAGVLSLNWVADPWEGAAVYVADGFVDRVIEKPERGTSTTNFNNAGIFVLPPEVLEIAARLEPSPRGEYELPVAMDRLLKGGARLRAVEVEGYWSDVARPGTALEINGKVISHLSALAGDRKGGGGREGLWIAPSAEVAEGAELRAPVYVAEGATVAEGAAVGPNVSLHEGCRVAERAEVADSVLLDGCQVGEGCSVHGAYVEAGAELPAGTVLPGSFEAPFVVPPRK